MDNYRNLYDLCVNNSTVAGSDLATGGHDAEAEFANGQAAFFTQRSWEWGAFGVMPYKNAVESTN